MNAPAAPAEVALPTVVDRARTALAVTPERDKALAELAAKSAGITKITNKAGYDELHASRMVLKNERVAIQKDGKAARDDAVKFSKAVVAEEARLVALIEPEERRLQALQDAEDERVEQEKQARIRAEADRIKTINQRIDWIRACVTNAVGKPAAQLAIEIADLEGLPITVELYAEKSDEARDAHAATLAKLRTLHAQVVGHDAEAAALAEQRRLLAEKQAELDRQDAARRAERDQDEAARKARQKQEDDARAARQREEDEARAARQREEDAARKYLADWDDAHREVLQRADEARVAAIRERINKLRAWAVFPFVARDELAGRIAELDTIVLPREAYEEFYDEAVAVRDNSLSVLRGTLAARERVDQERAATEKRKQERTELEAKADLWTTIEAVAEIVSDATDADGDLLPDADGAAVVKKVVLTIGTAILAREKLAALDKAA